MTYREEVIRFIWEKYGAEPEYLWLRFPNYTVFRHADNAKWFGIIMDVSRDRLGLDGCGETDVLNVKLSDPMLADFLTQQPGYLRGWHAGRGNWVSILLDGTVPPEEIFRWIDESYLATASGAKRQALRPPKEWLVPANPKYYDIERAFDARREIDWKQGAGIRTGDTVYLYVAAPVSAILYRCAVLRTDIPCRFRGGQLRVDSLMRIRLLRRYDPARFPFEALRGDYGVLAVRGPRGIPQKLSDALREGPETDEAHALRPAPFPTQK